MKPHYYLLAGIALLFSSCSLFSSDDDSEPVLISGCTDPNSFNYNGDADSSDGSCLSMIGCVGYSGGMNNSGTIGSTLQDPNWDQKMIEEIAIQRNFFNGIPASVYILYEPSPEYKNAYASPNGQILFGYHMFYYTVATYGELPVAGILAHEWGHRTQFSFGWPYQRSSIMELEADAFSGYYMALAKQYAWNNIQSYYANVYATGDYNYHHPSHHGTPNQRLAAAYFGVQTAIQALKNGVPYSYEELHQLFLNEIENVIVAGRASYNFKEVVYPKDLTQDYIQSLFPGR